MLFGAQTYLRFLWRIFGKIVRIIFLNKAFIMTMKIFQTCIFLALASSAFAANYKATTGDIVFPYVVF